jgi:hypothetical protein
MSPITKRRCINPPLLARGLALNLLSAGEGLDEGA